MGSGYSFNEIDITSASNLVSTFAQGCGIGCCFVDENWKRVVGMGFCCGDCKICRGTRTEDDFWVDTHRYGMGQSERFGGKYIYFCSCGFTFFASPVICDDNILGYLLAGPVLMIEPDDFWEIETLGKTADDETRQHYRELVAKLPSVSPKRVNHLAQLLYICAVFMGDAMGLNRLRLVGDANDLQNSIGSYLESSKLAKGDMHYPFEKETELSTAISLGDKPLAQQLLNDILGYIFFYSGADYTIIKMRVTELIVLLSRAAVSGGAEQSEIFELNNRFLNEINTLKNVDELCYWFAGAMDQFLDCVFKMKAVKHIDVIHRALTFIRNNYTQKITMEQTAAEVYLSPSFFSKIFSAEMGCSFTSFLNRLRIEKSKQLLLSDRVKLVDVALSVGYEDQSYFCKVFRKHTGMTPKKFQKQRGNKLPAHTNQG